MAIDRTAEFQPILDLLTCLEVTRQNQRLILDVIESNIEVWETMKLKQRSFVLHSTLKYLRESTEFQPQALVKSYFETHLLTII